MWSKGAGVRHVNCPVKMTPADEGFAASRHEQKQVTVTMGVFRKDGRIYVVKPNKEKTRVYAKEIIESPARMTENGEVVDFETRYAAGVVFTLTEADRWDLADAKDFLTKFARCIVCGRHLKAAKSVESSIGPVCAKYFAHHEHAPKTEGKTLTQMVEAMGVKVEQSCMTDDEKELISEIQRMNRESTAWVAANPGSWASGLVEDIAHWRNCGITSVAAFDEMERAESEKERRKASYDYDTHYDEINHKWVTVLQ
jgi:hypothetical protein